MLIPIRCFTCNKEISSKHMEYLKLLDENYTAGQALDKVGMDRICCRRMFLGHVDIAEKILELEY